MSGFKQGRRGIEPERIELSTRARLKVLHEKEEGSSAADRSGAPAAFERPPRSSFAGATVDGRLSREGNLHQTVD